MMKMASNVRAFLIEAVINCVMRLTISASAVQVRAKNAVQDESCINTGCASELRREFELGKIVCCGSFGSGDDPEGIA